MKLFFSLLIIAFTFCGTFTYSQESKNLQDITLSDVRNAFASIQPSKANEYLEAVMNNPASSTRDKVKAGRYWASLQARVYLDFDKASTKMMEIIALDSSNPALFLKYAEIAADFKEFELAMGNAKSAISFASTKKEKVEAYGLMGKIVYQSLLNDLSKTTANNEFTGFKIDQVLVTNAIKQLKRVIHEDPTQQELLKTIFGLEILSGKGANAIATWKDYFNYSDESNQLVIDTYETLASALNKLEESDFSHSSRKELAYALANARRFDLSLLMIRTIPSSIIKADDRLLELVAYSSFLTELELATTGFYRKTALGEGEPKAFRNQLIGLVKQLWNTFYWSGEPKQFSLDNVEIEIDERFGASIRIGSANGWFSMTWGHKVIEYKTKVSQYGQSSVMVFRSIDYLISNGFLGWYFDNNGVIGGWQSDEFVYQIRTRYLNDPLKVWQQLIDLSGRTDFKQKFRQQMEEDERLAQQEGTIIFQGMLSRMEFQANQELLQDIKQAGHEGAELKKEFLVRHEALTFQNEILSHEGRHLIDHLMTDKLPAPELEYRAKLSEIAFAKYPFMALSRIFRGGIDSSPHGQANKRLAENLYVWMEKNWREVEGIEASLHKGPQLFKLTNQQLVDVIRSFDPLSQL